MRKNEPARTFVLVSIIVFLLLLLGFFNPITIRGIKLRKVSILSDLTDVSKQEGDTGKQFESLIPKLKKRKSSFKEIIPPGMVCIDDYSEDKDGGMDNFYQALNNINDMNRPVRIAYYGDSFIEGDVLTGDLRQLLQNKYGGNGVGWVDCSSLSSTFRKTVYETSNGWLQHAITDHGFKRNLQGINERYFNSDKNSSTKLTCSKNRSHSTTCEYSEIYYYSPSPFTLTASINGEQQKMVNTETCKIASAKITGNIHSIKWDVTKAGPSSRFFGITMESKKGIMVDNFSMRGTPGIALASIPGTTLKSFSELHPYDLIVIHFGLNATTNDVLTPAYYRLYQRRMEKVVNHFKAAYPHTSILIVSVSDKCCRNGDGIQTAKGIEVLANYQQLIAYNTHVAYFNLLKAMVEKGGIKKMVENKQANLDYTHINFRGGRTVGKYFYDALMTGKNNYDRKENHTK